MDVYLIRHAHAGSRGPGSHDKWRPLSEKGHDQAMSLAELLADVDVGVVLSSTATRCVQTVEPLAKHLGLEVIESDALWEEATVHEAIELVSEHTTTGAVVSSHGNIIPEFLEVLAQQGVPITGRGCEKASVWVVSHDGTRFTGARYGMSSR